MDELMGAGLLRRLVRSCVLAVQYEEHTPEPYNPGLQPATSLGGGARSTPPPPPRPRRRADTPGPGNGNTQPIWPPPAAELAALTAAAEHSPPPAALRFGASARGGGTLRFASPYAAAAHPEEQVAPDWAAAAAAQIPTPLPEPELLQLTEAEADVPRLEIPPPRIPDFTLGAPLLPERAHDPHYYPGISDEPPPPELPHARWARLPRWAAFAAGGLVLFGAGMIVRSLAGSSGGNAVIDVTPLDAKVKLDGELIEATSSPRLREGLIHGEHTLEVERRGFISERRVFNLAEGEREQRVVITLLPEPVAPPPAAAPPPQPSAAAPAPAAPEPPQPVAKAAEAEPEKPLSAKELAKQRRAEKVAERYRARKAAEAEGKAGKSDAKLSRAEAKAARLEAKAARAERAAQAKAEKAEAKAARKGGGGAPTAMLKLNSTPWSEVYVDDRHVGHTPLLGLPLTAGKHTIRLVNPQLGGKKTLKIQLKPGQTLVKIVQL